MAPRQQDPELRWSLFLSPLSKFQVHRRGAARPFLPPTHRLGACGSRLRATFCFSQGLSPPSSFLPWAAQRL